MSTFHSLPCKGTTGLGLDQVLKSYTYPKPFRKTGALRLHTHLEFMWGWGTVDCFVVWSHAEKSIEKRGFFYCRLYFIMNLKLNCLAHHSTGLSQSMCAIKKSLAWITVHKILKVKWLRGIIQVLLGEMYHLCFVLFYFVLILQLLLELRCKLM